MATAKTTTRKTSTKKATVEPKVELEPVIESVVEEVEKNVEPVKNVAKEYKKDDVIPCRSVTAGYLGIVGPRTKQPYPFENMGDVAYIEYQDLYSWLTAQHPIIFKPFLIIEDTDLLEDVRWAAVKELYENMCALEDVNEILNLPVNEFKKKFPILPVGLKSAVKSEIVKRIGDGTFDSIGKIKVVDDVCGTSIGSMMI